MAKQRFFLVSLAVLVFQLVITVVVVAAPVLAFWLASSLAAYSNQPVWLAAVAGLVVFPVVPVWWEAWAYRRYRRAHPEPTRPRLLGFFTRVIVRTLIVSALCLGILIGRYPQAGFTALATRGDWMLTGQKGAAVERLRAGLFSGAEGLEWLYNATRKNPYERLAPRGTPAGKESGPPSGKTSGTPPSGKASGTPLSGKASGTPAKESVTGATDDGPARRGLTAPSVSPAWPMARTLHPAVQEMPPDAEKSIAQVARYLASRERDPWLRIKALHDYVADRVVYDVAALGTGQFPPQDAETVFRTRKSVCAGAANLLVALGDAIGEEIVYVVGVSRDLGGDVSGRGHAWNAARVAGQWHLIDPTWAAGHVNGSTFTKKYTTDYLFTPPEIFGIDHFPDAAQWQLREKPISRGEFMRQPALKPAFFAGGLKLIAPSRSQITVHGEVTVLLENPRRQRLLARLVPKGARDGEACTIGLAAANAQTSIRCVIGRSGTFQVWVFAHEDRPGEAKAAPTPPPTATIYGFVGQIEVNNP